MKPDALLTRCPGRSLAARRALLVRMLAARDEIAAHCDDARLPRIAACAGLSPCHFLRLFQRVFGETPHDMAKRCRFDRARALLAEGELSIAEVAHAIGMRNRCAFARAFREWHGVPPSAFRFTAALERAAATIGRAPAVPGAAMRERPAPVLYQREMPLEAYP